MVASYVPFMNSVASYFMSHKERAAYPHLLNCFSSYCLPLQHPLVNSEFHLVWDVSMALIQVMPCVDMLSEVLMPTLSRLKLVPKMLVIQQANLQLHCAFFLSYG